MNLHERARSLIRRANPEVDIVIYPYEGETVDASGNVRPQYGEPVELKAQMQPVSLNLRHEPGFEGGEIVKAFYITGSYESLVRAHSSGGAVIKQGENRYKLTGSELWSETAGWNRLVGVLQSD